MGKVLHGKVISPTRIERGHENARKKVYAEGRFGASLRGIRIAPNKMRLVVDLIRDLPVERAREVLRYSSKRAAYYVDRVLLSALGNADSKSEGRVGAEDLVVAAAYCDEGNRFRRFKSGPMGRARPIIRRTCHITVVLGEKPEEKANGSEKAKKAQKAAK